MVLVALVLTVALVAGLLGGGSLRNLGRVRLRGAPLVAVAVALQLTLTVVALVGEPGPWLVRALLAGSYAGLLGFVARNRHLPGMLLVLAGLACNAVVVVANAGMPVDPSAVQAVGGDGVAIDRSAHHALDDDALLPWLADIIPLPPLRTVVSVGDVLLATGVGLLAAALLRGLPGRRRAGVADPDQPDTPVP